MLIYEIVKPGQKIIAGDLVWCRDTERKIDHLINLFFEANIYLIQFLDAKEEVFSSEVKYLSEQARKDNFIKVGIPYPEQIVGIHESSDLKKEAEAKRKGWIEGILPHEFRNLRVSMNMKGFIAALDSFEKHLKILTQNDHEKLDSLHMEFLNTFPDVREVRNTNQHMEDRSRGLGAGRNPKQMELKPINTPLFASDKGILAFNVVTNTTYGATIADGSFGQVDVSPKSIESLQLILHKIIHTFNWEGNSVHLPSGDSLRSSKQKATI